jgi:uncharacterized protein Smg (DUF494 family)
VAAFFEHHKAGANVLDCEFREFVHAFVMELDEDGVGLIDIDLVV